MTPCHEAALLQQRPKRLHATLIARWEPMSVALQRVQPLCNASGRPVACRYFPSGYRHFQHTERELMKVDISPVLVLAPRGVAIVEARPGQE